MIGLPGNVRRQDIFLNPNQPVCQQLNWDEGPVTVFPGFILDTKEGFS